MTETSYASVKENKGLIRIKISYKLIIYISICIEKKK